MMGIHGGDIYKNHVLIDFSVNINPLGIPKSVKDVLHETVEMCNKYPDMEEEKLKKAVSNMLAVPKESILFGNGASQLFMGVVHSIKLFMDMNMQQRQQEERLFIMKQGRKMPFK